MTSSSSCKRFILLGDAGAGKSSFINFLYNFFYGTQNPNEIFCDQPKVKLAIPCANWLDFLERKYRENNSERNIHDQTQSQTQICTTYTFQNNKFHLDLIDTPGFNDTHGTNIDERNLTLIEDKLKSEPYLTGIILVINGAFQRAGGLSFQNFLRLLQSVWPNDLLNNCVAVLTNCDETTVNFNSSVLQDQFNVDESRTFIFQNSLFRWDPKNQTPKAMRHFQQDFEDNLEKTDQFLKTITKLNNVSTKSFQVGANKILLIEECVHRSIQSIIDLLEAYQKQQIAQESIRNAQHTMDNNKQWEQQREIKAVKWVEVPQPKYTRQSIMSDRSKAPSQEYSSSSNDRTVDPSKHSNIGHETSNLYPIKTNALPMQGLAASNVNDNYPYDQRIHSTGSANHEDTKSNSSSSSKLSPTSINYASAYDNPSFNKSSDNFSSSSRAGRPSTKPTQEKSNNKSHFSRTMSNNSDQPVGCSKKSIPSHYSDHSNYAYNHYSSAQTPVYKQQETKIQVVIPDNEARSHHDYAEVQAISLKERSQQLQHEQEILAKEINSYLQSLEKQVIELRSINRNYDIIEKNRVLLFAFQEIIKYFGDNPQMMKYYEETVHILSKK